MTAGVLIHGLGKVNSNWRNGRPLLDYIGQNRKDDTFDMGYLKNGASMAAKFVLFTGGLEILANSTSIGTFISEAGKWLGLGKYPAGFIGGGAIFVGVQHARILLSNLQQTDSALKRNITGREVLGDFIKGAVIGLIAMGSLDLGMSATKLGVTAPLSTLSTQSVMFFAGVFANAGILGALGFVIGDVIAGRLDLTNFFQNSEVRRNFYTSALSGALIGIFASYLFMPGTYMGIQKLSTLSANAGALTSSTSTILTAMWKGAFMWTHISLLFNVVGGWLHQFGFYTKGGHRYWSRAGREELVLTMLDGFKKGFFMGPFISLFGLVTPAGDTTFLKSVLNFVTTGLKKIFAPSEGFLIAGFKLMASKFEMVFLVEGYHAALDLIGQTNKYGVEQFGGIGLSSPVVTFFSWALLFTMPHVISWLIDAGMGGVFKMVAQMEQETLNAITTLLDSPTSQKAIIDTGKAGYDGVINGAAEKYKPHDGQSAEDVRAETAKTWQKVSEVAASKLILGKAIQDSDSDNASPLQKLLSWAFGVNTYAFNIPGYKPVTVLTSKHQIEKSFAEYFKDKGLTDYDLLMGNTLGEGFLHKAKSKPVTDTETQETIENLTKELLSTQKDIMDFVKSVEDPVFDVYQKFIQAHNITTHQSGTAEFRTAVEGELIKTLNAAKVDISDHYIHVLVTVIEALVDIYNCSTPLHGIKVYRIEKDSILNEGPTKSEAVSYQLQGLIGATKVAIDNAINPDIAQSQVFTIPCGEGKTLLNIALVKAFGSYMINYGPSNINSFSDLRILIVIDKAENVKQGFNYEKENEKFKNPLLLSLQRSIGQTKDTAFSNDKGNLGEINIIEKPSDLSPTKTGVFVADAQTVLALYFHNKESLANFNLCNIDEVEAVLQTVNLTYSTIHDVFKGTDKALQSKLTDVHKLTEAASKIMHDYLKEPDGNKTHFDTDDYTCMKYLENPETVKNQVLQSIDSDVIDNVGGIGMATLILTNYLNHAPEIFGWDQNSRDTYRLVPDEHGMLGYVLYDRNSSNDMKDTHYGNPWKALALHHLGQILYDHTAEQDVTIQMNRALNAFLSVSEGGANIVLALDYINEYSATKKGITVGMTGTVEGCKHIMNALGFGLIDIAKSDWSKIAHNHICENSNSRYEEFWKDIKLTAQDTPNELVVGAFGPKDQIIKALNQLGLNNGLEEHLGMGSRTHYTTSEGRDIYVYDNPSDLKTCIKSGIADYTNFGNSIHLVAKLITGSNVFESKGRTGDKYILAGENGEKFTHVHLFTTEVGTSSSMIQQEQRINAKGRLDGDIHHYINIDDIRASEVAKGKLAENIEAEGGWGADLQEGTESVKLLHQYLENYNMSIDQMQSTVIAKSQSAGPDSVDNVGTRLSNIGTTPDNFMPADVWGELLETADLAKTHALSTQEVLGAAKGFNLAGGTMGLTAGVLGFTAFMGAGILAVGTAALAGGLAGLSFTLGRQLANFALRLQTAGIEGKAAKSTGWTHSAFSDLSVNDKQAVLEHEVLPYRMAHGVFNIGLFSLVSAPIRNFAVRSLLGDVLYGAFSKSVNLLEDSLSQINVPNIAAPKVKRLNDKVFIATVEGIMLSVEHEFKNANASLMQREAVMRAVSIIAKNCAESLNNGLTSETLTADSINVVEQLLIKSFELGALTPEVRNITSLILKDIGSVALANKIGSVEVTPRQGKDVEVEKGLRAAVKSAEENKETKTGTAVLSSENALYEVTADITQNTLRITSLATHLSVNMNISSYRDVETLTKDVSSLMDIMKGSLTTAENIFPGQLAPNARTLGQITEAPITTVLTGSARQEIEMLSEENQITAKFFDETVQSIREEFGSAVKTVSSIVVQGNTQYLVNMSLATGILNLTKLTVSDQQTAKRAKTTESTADITQIEKSQRALTRNAEEKDTLSSSQDIDVGISLELDMGILANLLNNPVVGVKDVLTRFANVANVSEKSTLTLTDTAQANMLDEALNNMRAEFKEAVKTINATIQYNNASYEINMNIARDILTITNMDIGLTVQFDMIVLMGVLNKKVVTIQHVISSINNIETSSLFAARTEKITAQTLEHVSAELKTVFQNAVNKVSLVIHSSTGVDYNVLLVLAENTAVITNLSSGMVIKLNISEFIAKVKGVQTISEAFEIITQVELKHKPLHVKTEFTK
ncbi:MAG: hypothetical protein KJ864_06255, partial [Candidatus Omnitrophica bacterium]|nr:hypothetical protein [Candidatus Omnitrophota bacterium]